MCRGPFHAVQGHLLIYIYIYERPSPSKHIFVPEHVLAIHLGIYLVNTSQELYLWVGRAVPPESIVQLFGAAAEGMPEGVVRRERLG